MGRPKIYKTEKQKRKAQTKRTNDWNKEHRTAYTFKFNNVTEADIIETLESKENKTNYIKELIRKDLALK